MRRAGLILGMFWVAIASAAEPLPNFNFELSCDRVTVGDSPTLKVHAIIDYNGMDNTCTAEKGFHHFTANPYEISFKCEKPQILSTDKDHPILAWVLTGPIEGPKDKISKLVFVLDHATQKGAGFATSQDGQSHYVVCKNFKD